jgi:alanine dehydrogenase
MKIGILREGKVPPDKRVPLTPEQCKSLLNLYPNLQLVVQPSPIRCFTDQEYVDKGIILQEDLSDCDVLMGVKEVPVKDLLAGKTYLFFSHTIKKQPHNRRLLQTVLGKDIRLVDYELLTDLKGMRLIGFGRYAGLVGAYNGIRTYGLKNHLFELKPAHQCADLAEMKRELRSVSLPAMKIAVTGNGRVANGVVEIMEEAGIARLSVDEYLEQESPHVASYVQLEPGHYNLHKEGRPFELLHFFKHPDEYRGNFKRFCSQTDMLISAAYWDPRAPVLFSQQDMMETMFRLEVVADITCDIGGSIPSTIRATTIADPFYDYNIETGKEELPFSGSHHVSVMSVDNLPCELPKDASRDFGNRLLHRILPNVIGPDRNTIIERATIANNGELTERFKYLADYVAENSAS